MKLNQFLLFEMGDSIYPWSWTSSLSDFTQQSDKVSEIIAQFSDGTDNIAVELSHFGDPDFIHVVWTRNGWSIGMDKTDKTIRNRMMFTILDIIKTYTHQFKPKTIQFSAEKGFSRNEKRNSRSNLYRAMIKRFANANGYVSTVKPHNDRTDFFTLTKI